MFAAKRQIQGRHSRYKDLDPWHQHELSICSSDERFRQQVETVLPTKTHKQIYWAARRSHGDYDSLLKTLDDLQETAPDARILQRAYLSEHVYDFMPISHVIPGALVPVLDEYNRIVEDEVAAVSRTSIATT
jgi:hypothetical protein